MTDNRLEILKSAVAEASESYGAVRINQIKNCNELDLAGLISKAKSKTSGMANEILDKLDIDRRHILNPLTHDDHRTTYTEEIKSALADVELLRSQLRIYPHSPTEE